MASLQREISVSSRTMRASSSCADKADTSSPSWISGSFLRGLRSSLSIFEIVFCNKDAFNIAQIGSLVMHAIAIEDPGPKYRLVLREIAQPEPGAGEVL